MLEIKPICEGIMPGSLMRRLLVDILAWVITSDMRNEDRELQEEFLGNLAFEMI